MTDDVVIRDPAKQRGDIIIITAVGELVRIKPDGAMEFGPAYAASAAAEAFWTAVAQHDPLRATCRACGAPFAEVPGRIEKSS